MLINFKTSAGCLSLLTLMDVFNIEAVIPSYNASDVHVIFSLLSF
jgi:hypothetical protein